MNQVAVVNEAEIKNILSELSGEEEQQIKIDFLKICHDGEDKQGREIKRGMVSLSNQPEPIWTDTAKIHVLAQYFQYREQDESGKVLNKSILMPDFRKGEPIDMKGTLRCGKPTRKALNQMSEDDKRMWASKVKTTRIIRGLISYTGHTADGEEMQVSNVPFQHYMKGLAYNDFEKIIDSLPYGKKFHEFIINVNTEKRGKYYYTVFSIDFATPAILSSEVAETAKVFQEMAKQENSTIQRKYNEAMVSSVEDGQIYDAVADDTLDADLV